jgi:hypothetical protein
VNVGVDRRRVLQTALAAAAAVSLPLPAAMAAAPVDLSALQRRLRGALVVPGSADYDRERRTFVFNPRTDKHPAAIAKCSDEADIAACLEFAAANGLDVAVRSGGHDFLGASTCDGGILIDTRPMAACQLSASGASVVVGAGAKTGEVTQFLQRSNRAVPFGDSGDVGVAGLTLGGGYGWLSSKYGATCDNLLRARLILADGRRIVASEDEHPDLFWAIRGGGGNFGVVSQLEYATRDVGTVLAGQAVYAATDIGGFFRFYRDYMAGAPDELVIEVGVSPAEQPLISALACWSGDVETGRKVLAPLLAYGPPLAVSVAERPYDQFGYAPPQIQSLLHRQPINPGPSAAPPAGQLRGGSLGELSDAAIHEIGERIGTAQGHWNFSLTHHLHGAICRTPSTKSALVRPQGSFSFHFDAVWSGDDQTTRQMEWVEQSAAVLKPYSIPTYVNYLSSDNPLDVQRTYGGNFAKLQSVKRRYDPANTFHHNRNIPPAA